MRLGELGNLEEDAIDLTTNGYPNKPAYLANLGNSLRARFNCLGQLSDLEEAISTHRNAVELIPNGHPHKPNHLQAFGLCFQARFERLGELSDIEEAISWHKNAVDLIPDGHPNKANCLNDLGICFASRFHRLRELSDLEQAISLYSHAASTSIGPSIVRFRASLHWISCARDLRHHSLLDAYSVAIGLLPQLAWIGLSLTHCYRELAEGANVVRDAAAAALDSGLPEIAVEWLEQGRSIVLGELFQLRSSFEVLSSTHPDHARSLRELSAALDRASATREKSLSSLQSPTVTECDLQRDVDRPRTLAIKRDKLLLEIRQFPGFERFLLHTEFSQLRASAHSGPVVILNAAETRCDALIIRSDVDHAIHVPLPNFTLQRCAGFQKMLKSLLGHYRVPRCDDSDREASQGRANLETLLSTLWNGVVKPVLDALDFSVRGIMSVEFVTDLFISVLEQTPGNMSRIFWCPTGPFVFLPIHAAGLYGPQYSQPGHKVSDFVVSSYIPTLSILSPSPNPDAGPDDALCLLAVRQPPSDGLSRLPGVHAELEYIRAAINNSPSAQTTLLESSVGTVEEVLALMEQADWVHFACHGIQDDANPTESGLCLADRRRLKLSDIIALSRPRGGLAFLSACQTAMGDENLTDEAIHIAAGMLFAGYGGVVGTMWSISDELAPRVAKDVYGQLLRKGTRPDYREAARALHEAIGRLRDNGASFDKWLPFVHVGL